MSHSAEFFAEHEKSPSASAPAGFLILRSLWPSLAQAMAVRRHIGPVMVMMTVMAVNLHLLQSYGKGEIVSTILIKAACLASSFLPGTHSLQLCPASRPAQHIK